MTPQIERRWPRDGWGRRLISKTTAISAERPTTTLRGLPSLPSAQASRSPRRTGRDSSAFFLPPFSARSRLHFLRRLPLGNLGAETIHSAASERATTVPRGVAIYPVTADKNGSRGKQCCLEFGWGVSKMDGAELCSKVTATSINGGNGDIAWDKSSTLLVRHGIARFFPPSPALPSEVDRRNLLLAERKEKELLLLQ